MMFHSNDKVGCTFSGKMKLLSCLLNRKFTGLRVAASAWNLMRVCEELYKGSKRNSVSLERSTV